MIVFFRILVIGTIICFNVVNGNVDLSFDLSTNQPTRSSALHESTTPSSKANDGDTGRTHPNQFHSACNAATYKSVAWWGVELKKTVTDPRVTFFAPHFFVTTSFTNHVIHPPNQKWDKPCRQWY